MKFRGRLHKVQKTLAAAGTAGGDTTGKPFARFWLWCGGLMKPADLTEDERADWADYRARLRERAMADPQMMMLQQVRRERNLPPLTEPPDDVIEALISLKRTPVPATPDTTTKE